ncbi:hypothetical protein LCGC14_1675800, partial [marine sediment metagenome]
MAIKKKITVKKKPAKEYVRKGVRLSKKIHEELIDAIEAFEDDDDAWKPYVYMLGENKHRVVKTMIKISDSEMACTECCEKEQPNFYKYQMAINSFDEIEVISGDFQVRMEYIGEGKSGDYT